MNLQNPLIDVNDEPFTEIDYVSPDQKDNDDFDAGGDVHYGESDFHDSDFLEHRNVDDILRRCGRGWGWRQMAQIFGFSSALSINVVATLLFSHELIAESVLHSLATYARESNCVIT